MNYLKEMNETQSGFEVIYYDGNLIHSTSSFDTQDKAMEFINTLNLVGIV